MFLHSAVQGKNLPHLYSEGKILKSTILFRAGVEGVYSFMEKPDEIFCINSCNLDGEVRPVGQRWRLMEFFRLKIAQEIVFFPPL